MACTSSRRPASCVGGASGRTTRPRGSRGLRRAVPSRSRGSSHMADPDPIDDNPYTPPRASIVPVASWADDPLAPPIAPLGLRVVAFVSDYLLLLGAFHGFFAAPMIVGGHGPPVP